MKIAYLDTVGGISGDMTLAAFVSAGLPIGVLSDELSKLPIKGIELNASRVERNGISAVKIDVVTAEEHDHHRHLEGILSMIDASPLAEVVKVSARKIFMELAEAESRVHNLPVEKVHLHEVGALDSIADIVGAAVCFHRLGIEKIYTSPVKLGSGGFIETAHGKLPLPAPATVEILKNYPTVLTDVPFELTTPTGASIVKAMSEGVLAMQKMKIERIGYGAGSRQIPGLPNILRVMIGELLEAYEGDEMVVVESNIDDMNPEIYPFVIEKLLASGSREAFITPVIMKKGRPGLLLSVLTGRENLDNVLATIYSETTTLGVRMYPVERRMLEREERIVNSDLGQVRMKVVKYGGKERLIPEFEECRRIALEKGIPLKEVYRILELKFSKNS